MSYHDYISEATLRYLMQQYPEHTPGWLASFTDEVRRLEEMWKVMKILNLPPEDLHKCFPPGGVAEGELPRMRLVEY